MKGQRKAVFRWGVTVGTAATLVSCGLGAWIIASPHPPPPSLWEIVFLQMFYPVRWVWEHVIGVNFRSHGSLDWTVPIFLSALLYAFMAGFVLGGLLQWLIPDPQNPPAPPPASPGHAGQSPSSNSAPPK